MFLARTELRMCGLIITLEMLNFPIWSDIVLYACTHTHAHAWMNAHMDTYKCIHRLHTHAHMHMHACQCNSHAYTHTQFTHTCTSMNECIHGYMHMHAWVHTCDVTHAHIHACVHAWTHTDAWLHNIHVHDIHIHAILFLPSYFPPFFFCSTSLLCINSFPNFHCAEIPLAHQDGEEDENPGLTSCKEEEEEEEEGEGDGTNLKPWLNIL